MSSGGVDSSITMLLLKKEGHEVFPMHVDYGHRAEEREWKSCQQICEHIGLEEPVRVSLSGTEYAPSSLIHRDLNIEKDAFFPTRNLLFAVLGASYAFSKSCSTVALGILANPIFPDQTSEFLEKAESCIGAALGVKMKLLTPLISLDKRETLKLAKEHNLPLGLAYFCHSGGERPCGECISCKERAAAESMLLGEE